MAGFIDIEATLITYLSEAVPYAGCSIKTPPDLLTKMPFIQIRAVSGADDNITDSALVDVDTFTATDPTNPNYAQAQQLGSDVREAMRSLRHRMVGNALIDDVDIISSPSRFDYGDEHVTRLIAVYRVSARRAP